MRWENEMGRCGDEFCVTIIFNMNNDESCDFVETKIKTFLVVSLHFCRVSCNTFSKINDLSALTSYFWSSKKTVKSFLFSLGVEVMLTSLAPSLSPHCRIISVATTSARCQRCSNHANDGKRVSIFSVTHPQCLQINVLPIQWLAPFVHSPTNFLGSIQSLTRTLAISTGVVPDLLSIERSIGKDSRKWTVGGGGRGLTVSVDDAVDGIDRRRVAGAPGFFPLAFKCEFFAAPSHSTNLESKMSKKN